MDIVLERYNEKHKMAFKRPNLKKTISGLIHWKAYEYVDTNRKVSGFLLFSVVLYKNIIYNVTCFQPSTGNKYEKTVWKMQTWH